MLGLLRQVVRPRLGLRESVRRWRTISTLLREPPRKREMQIEKITNKGLSLS